MFGFISSNAQYTTVHSNFCYYESICWKIPHIILIMFVFLERLGNEWRMEKLLPVSAMMSNIHLLFKKKNDFLKKLNIETCAYGCKKVTWTSPTISVIIANASVVKQVACIKAIEEIIKQVEFKSESNLKVLVTFLINENGLVLLLLLNFLSFGCFR